MKPPKPWTTWQRPEDLPIGLRRTIQEGAFVPLLDPKEAMALKKTILETFCEVLDAYMEDNELRWRCDHVHRYSKGMSMEAVFRAISLEVGVSVSRLKKIWYSSRRRASVKSLVQESLKGKA